jgi:hypothetical protein
MSRKVHAVHQQGSPLKLLNDVMILLSLKHTFCMIVEIRLIWMKYLCDTSKRLSDRDVIGRRRQSIGRLKVKTHRTSRVIDNKPHSSIRAWRITFALRIWRIEKAFNF